MIVTTFRALRHIQVISGVVRRKYCTDAQEDGFELFDIIQDDNVNFLLILGNYFPSSLTGKTYMLDLRYRVAANLPIDMYFVMDFTVTMRDRIQDLADLTEELSMKKC